MTAVLHDLPLLLSFAFAAIAAGAIAWALWIWRTLRREADLLALVRERTTQLEDANRRLETLSYVDALTGVANRRAFDEAMDIEWRRGIRSRHALSVVLLDIDHFKQFNDACGHQAGDQCLAQVAAALKGVVRRAADCLARYGGEEFVVLLPDTDGLGALVVAERMRAAVQALAVPHPSSEVGVVTVSIGVSSVVPTDQEQAEILVAGADRALYDAKRQGRNRVGLADTALAPDTTPVV